MDCNIKQLSSLIKLRSHTDMNAPELNSAMVLAGESFSYQICFLMTPDSKNFMGTANLKFEIVSELKEYISLYFVRDVIMDFTTFPICDCDDYLTKTPGTMPDLLVPLKNQNYFQSITDKPSAFWIKVDVPDNFKGGTYPITINTTIEADKTKTYQEATTLNLEVISAKLSEQSTIFTQWFHADCIATAHNVEIYSEEHWDLIEKYIKTASDVGINMILTPTLSPALDTLVGTSRPCTQLVKITKEGNKYSFDFTLLQRWIDICLKHNIKYFENAHLFSQWGAGYSPNITVYENGIAENKFGWHVPSKDPSYKEFLEQYLPALTNYLREQNILDKTFFHISDEPTNQHLENYTYAYNTVKPLICGRPIMDAISHIEFYDTGMIDTPVTITSALPDFLERNIENQWAYYCCVPHEKVGNRFLSMPSYRNRILGLQLYKYNIKGFLHWGYNFYFSRLSRHEINPYVTTSADLGFPSGDAFSVYPIKNDVAPSLRALIFKEALQDIEVCRTLEQYIGKDAVVKMIDDAAGMNITFEDYPRNDDFIPSLMDKIKHEIKKYI